MNSMGKPAVELSVEVMEDGNWLGGSIYIDNLLATLSSLPEAEWPQVRLRFLSSPATAFAQRLRRHPVLCGARTGGTLLARVRRLHRAAVRRLPGLAAVWKDRPERVHFPAFDAAQAWRTNLFWIPDFQPLHLPELFSAEERRLRGRAMAEIAAQPGVVLLSSHAALADYQRFFPKALAEARVWSFCSSIDAGTADEGELAGLDLPERFFYVANQFWRHKDHATVLRALAVLRGRGIAPCIVCTGQQNDRRDPSIFAGLMALAEELGVKAQLRLPGIVPRETQVALFRRAVAVVQPSRFEGWSTVLEDAKALGRPIIASDLAVHMEQLRDMPRHRIFALGNVEALAEHIAEAWDSWPLGPDLAAEQVAVARRDALRVQSAREFLAILEQAARLSRDQSGK